MNPIGIFDSGIGGLTVMQHIVSALPQYDYVYLGDNARAPYGNRSFDTVYEYTLQSVKWLFDQGCPLVILACNTASAKALRNIQQLDLPQIAPNNRVLGVIRPTTELVGSLSANGHLGLFATYGTVSSESYLLEIKKFWPQVKLTQVACPMFVPLIENNEHLGEGADFFINKYINQLLEADPDIDTLLLACTHYPLIKSKLEALSPVPLKVIDQGEIVANSLLEYLEKHKEMANHISQNGTRVFYSTDKASDFDQKAKNLLGLETNCTQIHL